MDEPKLKPKSFEDIMQANPFDDMSVTLDTRYIDLGVGYNKQSGARLSATIDLTSIGSITEDEVRSAKNEYQKKLMELDLERRRILNEKLMKGEPIPTISFGQPLDVTIEKTPEKKPVVFPTMFPKNETKEKEAEVVQQPVMGAKAIDDDE